MRSNTWFRCALIAVAFAVPGLFSGGTSAAGATPQWSASAMISGPSYAGRPDIDMTPDGARLVAAWDEAGRVYTRSGSVTTDGTVVWTEPVMMSNALGYPRASFPRIAISDNGSTAIVAWVRQDTETTFSFVARTASLTAGAISWGNTTAMSDSSTINPGAVSVGISADGSSATVVWNFSQKQIGSRSGLVQGTSSSWGPITELTGEGQAMEMAISTAGTDVLVVWHASTESNQYTNTIYARSARVNGSSQSWSPTSTVALGIWPNVAMSADGSKSLVVALDWSGTGYVTRARAGTLSKNGIIWGDASDQPIGPDSFWQKTALSGDGSIASIAWENHGSGVIESRQAQISYNKNGGKFQWSGVQTLSKVEEGIVLFPQITLASNGRTAVSTWYQNLGAKWGDNWLEVGVPSVKVATASIQNGVAYWNAPNTLFIAGPGGYLDFEQTKSVTSTDGAFTTAIWTGVQGGQPGIFWSKLGSPTVKKQKR